MNLEGRDAQPRKIMDLGEQLNKDMSHDKICKQKE